MITIEHASNGYVIRNKVEDGDDFGNTMVVEEKEGEYGALYAARDLLWGLIDMLGVYGSKHDARRIRIYIENREGEKVDD